MSDGNTFSKPPSSSSSSTPLSSSSATSSSISQNALVQSVESDKPGLQQKQIGKYLVQVIREKCISAGSCVAIAPRVFALDEEQLAIVLSQDGEDDDTKLLAAQSCPTAAIIVTDTTTNTQVWPPIFEEEET